jgi:site-specific DNA-cytosine methylase
VTCGLTTRAKAGAHGLRGHTWNSTFIAPGAPDPDFEPGRDIGIVQVHRLDAPAWTVTATHWNNKMLKLDGGLRYLTAGELARLQTFPDGWPFAGRDDDARLKQIGNAVPPDGAAAVMAAVRDALA